MPVNWTKAQQSAIEDRGGTLLVSAAAGSGKTAVLTQRVVSLLCDGPSPIPADRILAVTFTRAAAAQLRARIAAALAQRAAAQPGSTFLKRQKLLLGRAAICTIDALCMQLLRENFARLGLAPDFGLADDAEAYALREEALADGLEQLYGQADFCAFSALYGRARTDARAAATVLSLYDFLRTLPDPGAVRGQFLAMYENGAPLCETAWGRLLLQHAGALCEAALALTAEARGIVQAEQALAGYAPALEEDAAFFGALLQDVRAGRWDAAAVRAHGYAPPAFRPVRGYEGGDMDTVKALRAQVKALLAKLRESVFVCSEAEFEADRAAAAPHVRALLGAVELFEQVFTEKKLAEKKLEYSDFERLALRLLCGENGEKTPAAKEISRRFESVFVDEYQDTNALQARLYECLANEDGSNLFYVGDAKQSIYRFRLASPESFLQKRAACAPYRPGGPHPAALMLEDNFRSAQNVVGAVNDVFCAVMSREVGGIDYAREQLRCGAPDGYDGGPMQLLLSGEDAGTDADVVARHIRGMLAAGFAVRDGQGGTRPCRPEDFCILLRSRANFAQYEAALERAGVSAAADTGEDLLSQPEVGCVLSLLRVVDNPAQDIHMAAVMLSGMFGFSPDDLARLRLACPQGTLYAAVLQSGGEKEQRLAAVLRALRARAACAPLYEVCGDAYARTGWPAVAGAMENGPQRRENLRTFAAYMAAADARGLSLDAFLRGVDAALEAGGAAQAAPGAAGGAVSIMTIHRSKGLEFPIVVLAECQRRFNFRDSYEPVLLHPVLGLGLRLRAGEGGLYETAPHAAVRLAGLREAVDEEMRILYVALTRAKDKLIAQCAMPSPEKTLAALAAALRGGAAARTQALAGAASFSTWLCAAALLHPDCESLRKLAGAAGLAPLPAQGHIEAVLCGGGGQAVPAVGPQPQAECSPDEDALRALRQNFAAPRPNAALEMLPVKMSVSALSHAGAARVLSRPAFLYKEGLTGAERGTATHSVLQFADLAAARENLAAELQRLVREGYLAPELRAHLDEAGLAAFFSSPLLARMLSAQKLLREYAFLTSVSAKYVQPDIPPQFATRTVLVQGIADAVLVNGGEAEIVDYKTDRAKAPAALVESYARQLRIYKGAVEKRLGVSVKKLTLYAVSLRQEVDVPLAEG